MGEPGRRVLVTGGAGFIGAHVVRAFRRAGWTVAVVDDLRRGRREALPPDVELVVADVADARAAAFARAFAPRVVVHLAAQVSLAASLEDPRGDARENVLGTVAVVHWALQAGVRRLILASSAAVYGVASRLPVEEEHPVLPCSPYGVSKLAGEHYVRVLAEAAGREWCVLRYANVYGPGQRAEGEAGVVAAFAGAACRGEPLMVHGDGQQSRDFVFVEDVAQATLLAAYHPAAAGQAFNISTGRETRVLELAEAVWEAAGHGAPARLTFGPERPGDVRRSALAPDKAWRLLGWRARVELPEGLARTLKVWQAPAAGEGAGA